MSKVATLHAFNEGLPGTIQLAIGYAARGLGQHPAELCGGNMLVSPLIEIIKGVPEITFVIMTQIEPTTREADALTFAVRFMLSAPKARLRFKRFGETVRALNPEGMH